MNAAPQVASHKKVLRPYSVLPSRLGSPILYVSHPPVDDAAGKPGEAALGQPEAQSDTHRPWNIRLGRWVVRQLNRKHPLSTTDIVARSAPLALVGLEEIGALSRYAVEKFISTLTLVQSLPWVAETPALSAAAWVQPIERLTGEYQQALLVTLDETGRQITAALYAGQPPSPLADAGRCRMDRLSEFYVNTCRTICQGRN